MSISCYHLTKQGNMKLSKNFRLKEFQSKDGSDAIILDSQLIEKLQKLRDRIGRPVVITSGFRTESHNRAVGGSVKSQHMNGRAADVKVYGLQPIQVYNIAKEIGFNGVGLYDTFVHVDVRDNKSYFDYRTKK